MLSGHDQLHVFQDVDDEDSGSDDECDEAVIIPPGQIGSFMNSQFTVRGLLINSKIEFFSINFYDF